MVIFRQMGGKTVAQTMASNMRMGLGLSIPRLIIRKFRRIIHGIVVNK